MKISVIVYSFAYLHEEQKLKPQNWPFLLWGLFGGFFWKMVGKKKEKKLGCLITILCLPLIKSKEQMTNS